MALLPEDFSVRLTRLKEALGLTWEGFSSMIGVDYRQMLRWRKKGAEPSGGAMLALGGPSCPGAQRLGNSPGSGPKLKPR